MAAGSSTAVINTKNGLPMQVKPFFVLPDNAILPQMGLSFNKA